MRRTNEEDETIFEWNESNGRQLVWIVCYRIFGASYGGPIASVWLRHRFESLGIYTIDGTLDIFHRLFNNRSDVGWRNESYVLIVRRRHIDIVVARARDAPSTSRAPTAARYQFLGCKTKWTPSHACVSPRVLCERHHIIIIHKISGVRLFSRPPINTKSITWFISMLVLLLCVCVAHVCAAKTICVFFLRAQTNKLHATIHTYRQQQRQRSESNNNNNRRSADNNNKMGHHKGRPSEFENWFPEPGSRSFEARRNCHEYIFRVGVPQWTIPRFTNNKYHVHIPCLLFIARLWLFLAISIECINFVSINERICFIPFFFWSIFFVTRASETILSGSGNASIIIDWRCSRSMVQCRAQFSNDVLASVEQCNLQIFQHFDSDLFGNIALNAPRRRVHDGIGCVIFVLRD